MAEYKKMGWTSKVSPDPGPVEGIDNLPNPIGINRKALRDAEERSEKTPMGGGPNNGDNPSIADSINFASGTDVRSYEQRGPSNPAAPGKPGA